MDIETSLKKLYSLHTFGIKLGLENIISFLNHLGNPQKKLNAFHIAGSNGKGSTASFISSILQEFGFKVGLYTSPHFVKFNERVVINGAQIGDGFIADFISEHENYIDEHQLTFFEVTTALAFQYFRKIEPDYCVIETGLGGRLDATNVLNPLAVVITSISLEHTNVLGDTLKQIAYEKAAIIKNNSKVFTGMLPEEAEEIVITKCKETSSEYFNVKDFLTADLTQAKIFSDSHTVHLNPPLKGSYQKKNAALAALTISKTLQLQNEQNYLNGISKVRANTGLQGRYEYYSRNPTIIFDSAHNPEGVTAFLNEFDNEPGNFKRKILIFGAMRDKAISEMLLSLTKYFDEILLAEINYERAAKQEDLKNLCNNLKIGARIIERPAKFIRDFILNSNEECLVVIGSMYLLGEIKQQLLYDGT